MPWWFAVSFAIWILYGVWRARLPRPRTGGSGPFAALLLLVAGAVALIAGLGCAYWFDLLRGPRQVVGFAVVTLAGLAFVHTQVEAALRILTVAVTKGPAPTSEPEKDTAP